MKICDNLIINQLINKDYDAFEEFYHKYVGLVHFVISMHITNKDIIDELTKEVFIILLDRIDLCYSSGLTLKTWIATLTKEYCLNYLKTNGFASTTKEECKTTKTTSEDTHYRILKEDLKSVLEPLEYQVLFLKLESGMNHKEISLFLEIPIDESRNIYQEAIRKVEL